MYFYTVTVSHLSVHLYSPIIIQVLTVLSTVGETYCNVLFSTEADPACYRMGCCPKIVVYPKKKGSVIQPFTGYRGNVAIIIDWGGDSDPCNPYRRRCTLDDTPFL